MILGHLISHTVQDHNSAEKEVGDFRLEVFLPTKSFNNSTDKRSLVNQTVGAHLASAVVDTQLGQEAWGFQATPELQKYLDYPPLIQFG